MTDTTLMTLTADIVSAHVSNNDVPAGDVPTLIRSVFDALARAAEPQAVEAPRPEPAVPIPASIKPNHLVCLEDGAKLKMLKRYLRTNYGMSPEQYRARWNLPADYPMVAPDYAATRRELAVKIGLGGKPDARSAAPARKRLGLFHGGATDTQEGPATARSETIDA